MSTVSFPQIESGGIYFLVSHVLGKRIGGAVGLIYTFGQACATSLVALGFGESMAKLAGVASPAAMKTLSVLVLVVLNGVKITLSIIRFLLLSFSVELRRPSLRHSPAAAAHVLFGAGHRRLFAGRFPVHALRPRSVPGLFPFSKNQNFLQEVGIGPLTSQHLSDNWHSHYGPANCSPPGSTEFAGAGEAPHSAESFFSVFGVLFANFIGVLAGPPFIPSIKS
jgi:hypothetical protein